MSAARTFANCLKDHLDSMVAIKMQGFPSHWKEEERREAAELALFGAMPSGPALPVLRTEPASGLGHSAGITIAETSSSESDDHEARQSCKTKETNYGQWWLDGFGPSYSFVLSYPDIDRRRRRPGLARPRHDALTPGEHGAPGTGFQATKNPSAYTVAARRVGDMPPSHSATLWLLGMNDAQGIEARSDETPQAVQPGGQEPGAGTACAQTQSPNSPSQGSDQ